MTVTLIRGLEIVITKISRNVIQKVVYGNQILIDTFSNRGSDTTSLISLHSQLDSTREELECWNINGNKSDQDGNMCDEYTSGSKCGNHDDEDFNSLEMCCGCGGGKHGKI